MTYSTLRLLEAVPELNAVPLTPIARHDGELQDRLDELVLLAFATAEGVEDLWRARVDDAALAARLATASVALNRALHELCGPHLIGVG